MLHAEKQLGLVCIKSWECILHCYDNLHPTPRPSQLFSVIRRKAMKLIFCLLQLKAYDQAAVIAGYVMSQEGKKFNRVWYQVRQDCVLYKFRAHEVSEGRKGGKREEMIILLMLFDCRISKHTMLYLYLDM